MTMVPENKNDLDIDDDEIQITPKVEIARNLTSKNEKKKTVIKTFLLRNHTALNYEKGSISAQ